MPKSIELKTLSIKAMTFSLDRKEVTASGGTVRYKWLAHVEAVGIHCGWDRLEFESEYKFILVANSKMSSGIILPFIPFLFLPESNAMIS